MLLHYAWFFGNEQNIWLYFVNQTGKPIKSITWVVKVSGEDDELELTCDDEVFGTGGRIYRYIFRTKYSGLDTTSVQILGATVTFTDGTVVENPEMKDEHDLRFQVANAESRKQVPYYQEPLRLSFGSKSKSGAAGSKEERLAEKKKYQTLGIIFLFLFFPVGLYFLFKSFQIGE